MKCNNCGRVNEEASKFCQYCGTILPKPAVRPPGPPELPVASGGSDPWPEPSGEPGGPSAWAEPAGGSSGPSAWPEPGRGPDAPAWPLPAPAPPASVYSGASNPAPAGVPPAAGYPQQSFSQMGQSGVSALDIWGPFAGYGTRGHHFPWLLDNLGHRAQDLHNAIAQRFSERGIPQTEAGWRALTGKGIVVEKRPFYIIQRGITTVALYIGRFGKDLYISQVTYAKGPISNVRALIVTLIFLFQFLFVVGYGPALSASVGSFDPFFGTGPSTGSLAFLMCVIGPLGFLNFVLVGLIVLYSLFKWLSEKDILSLLRIPPNEFQLDDIVALEKSVEETVRESLDGLGIDPDLMKEAPERLYRRRLF